MVSTAKDAGEGDTNTVPHSANLPPKVEHHLTYAVSTSGLFLKLLLSSSAFKRSMPSKSFPFACTCLRLVNKNRMTRILPF